MQYWSFIKKIHVAYKGIVGNLARLTGLSEEWWNSHGRPASTFNQHNTGKKWQPIEVMAEACDLYEEAAAGAGVALAFEFYQAVKAKYCRRATVDQREITNGLIKESGEAAAAVNCKDFNEMSGDDLEHAKTQIKEAMEANQKALDSIAEVEKRRGQKREIESRYIYGSVNN